MQKRHNELDIASKELRESTKYGKIEFEIENDVVIFVNTFKRKKIKDKK